MQQNMQIDVLGCWLKQKKGLAYSQIDQQYYSDHCGSAFKMICQTTRYFPTIFKIFLGSSLALSMLDHQSVAFPRVRVPSGGIPRQSKITWWPFEGCGKQEFQQNSVTSREAVRGNYFEVWATVHSIRLFCYGFGQMEFLVSHIFDAQFA